MNLKYLNEAQEFYSKNGFKNISVPWMVTPEASKVSLPKNIAAFTVNNNLDLVGSAEQSFIQMFIDNNSKISDGGLFQAFSPCFRDEPEDFLHHKWFAKIELININPKNELKELVNILTSAKNCMKSLAKKKSKYIDEIKIKDAYDLIYFNSKKNKEPIELGSYGIREYKNFVWVYGTGLAEPRFSQAVFNMEIFLK